MESGVHSSQREVIDLTGLSSSSHTQTPRKSPATVIFVHESSSSEDQDEGQQTHFRADPISPPFRSQSADSLQRKNERHSAQVKEAHSLSDGVDEDGKKMDLPHAGTKRRLNYESGDGLFAINRPNIKRSSFEYLSENPLELGQREKQHRPCASAVSYDGESGSDDPVIVLTPLSVDEEKSNHTKEPPVEELWRIPHSPVDVQTNTKKLYSLDKTLDFSKKETSQTIGKVGDYLASIEADNSLCFDHSNSNKSPAQSFNGDTGVPTSPSKNPLESNSNVLVSPRKSIRVYQDAIPQDLPTSSASDGHHQWRDDQIYVTREDRICFQGESGNCEDVESTHHSKTHNVSSECVESEPPTPGRKHMEKDNINRGEFFTNDTHITRGEFNGDNINDDVIEIFKEQTVSEAQSTGSIDEPVCWRRISSSEDVDIQQSVDKQEAIYEQSSSFATDQIEIPFTPPLSPSTNVYHVSPHYEISSNVEVAEHNPAVTMTQEYSNPLLIPSPKKTNQSIFVQRIMEDLGLSHERTSSRVGTQDSIEDHAHQGRLQEVGKPRNKGRNKRPANKGKPRIVLLFHRHIINEINGGTVLDTLRASSSIEKVILCDLPISNSFEWRVITQSIDKESINESNVYEVTKECPYVMTRISDRQVMQFIADSKSLDDYLQLNSVLRAGWTIYYVVEGHGNLDGLARKNDSASYKAAVQQSILRPNNETRATERGISKEALTKVYLALGCGTNATLKKSMSIAETCSWLVDVTNFISSFPFGKGDDIQENMQQWCPQRFFSARRMQNVWEQQLCMIPGVSVEIAQAIKSRYPGPAYLFELYLNNAISQASKEALLSDIAVSTTDDKKVGIDLSRYIHRTLCPLSPN